MKYQVAEKFFSVQGEGQFTGTPMAFIRFVGCSVGKRVCHACDTDFDQAYGYRGGGLFEPGELVDWVQGLSRVGVIHVCLTGGEPLDQDLVPLIEAFGDEEQCYQTFHIETSGTVMMPEELSTGWRRKLLWICVSPKPGYLLDMLKEADEIKVIVPGLGSGDGWPTIEDAWGWAEQWSKPVYIQPRNLRNEIDRQNLAYCEDIIRENPLLRLSLQTHKLLKVR